MKRLLLFFTLAAISMLTMCAKIDYACSWSFIIINRTDSDVTVMQNGITENTITGEKAQVIYRTVFECGKNPPPFRDLFENRYVDYGDVNMFTAMHPNKVIKMQVGTELMPDAIFWRKYWSFDNTKNRQGTYTLTITDELIETVKKSAIQ